MSDDKKVTFNELHNDKPRALKMQQYLEKVNAPPPNSWLKKNKFANNSEYLPIDKVEWLLDSIFQEWRCEVKDVQVAFQSIMVTVRIHYRIPTTGEWSYHDGVGAKDVQKDSGSKFSVESVKDSGVMLALPIAKAYAIKDACDHIGRMFGRDVNRKGTIEFVGAYSETKEEDRGSKEDARLIGLIEKADTKEKLESFKAECNNQKTKLAYETAYRKFK